MNDKIIRVKGVDEYVQGVWVAKTTHDDCHIQPVDPPEVEFVSAKFEDITDKIKELRKIADGPYNLSDIRRKVLEIFPPQHQEQCPTCGATGGEIYIGMGGSIEGCEKCFDKHKPRKVEEQDSG